MEAPAPVEDGGGFRFLLRLRRLMEFGFTLKPDVSLDRVVSLTRLADRIGFA